MKLKVPEWLYLDPTKAKQPDDRDSWGYPKINAHEPADKPEEDTPNQQETSTDELRSAFSVRHAGVVAVDLVRRGWNYQGNGVVTAGINNLQYRQPETALTNEDTL